MDDNAKRLKALNLWIDTCSDAQAEQLTLALKLAKWRRDPWAFLTDVCWTIDEDDPQEPIKRYPSDRPYLREVCDVWQRDRLTVWSKSR